MVSARYYGNFPSATRSRVLITCIFYTTVSALAEIPIVPAPETLPLSVDNRATPFFPPVIAQIGESCASANSVGYVFTYEINAARGISSADSADRYPYFWTFNFLNDGTESHGTHRMFIDAWNIIRTGGAPTWKDFGFYRAGSVRWMSGYEHYYNAMHNRVAVIDSLCFGDTATFIKMKQWLFDHGNGSPTGGIFTFTVSAYGVQDARIADGAHQGEYIVHTFGSDTIAGPHTLAVVGYDDNIPYDFNRDGSYTTGTDINGDGKITIADGEYGAFICANTWGTSSGDNGFSYVPYRLFALPWHQGGILDDQAYFITVLEEYTPLRTFKLTITHNQRNSIALSVGISADTGAVEPEHVRPLPQFSHAGGNLPMCGFNASSTIELGLDVTDLADSITGPSPATYFLIVDSDTDIGSCDSLALMDYSFSAATYRSADAPQRFSTGRNYLRIVAPAAGITGPGRRQPRNDPTPPAVRRSAGRLSMIIPEGYERAELFTAAGKRIATATGDISGRWISFPKKTINGTLIIRISGKSGTRSVKFGISGH